MRHVPHFDLTAYPVRANNLKQLPVSLITEASIEIDERVSRAESQYLIFLVEGYTQDILWALQRQAYSLSHFSQLPG